MVDFSDSKEAADRLSAATEFLSNPRDREIARQYVRELRQQTVKAV